MNILKPASVRLEVGRIFRGGEDAVPEDHPPLSRKIELEAGLAWLGHTDHVELTCKAEHTLQEADIVWYINKMRMKLDSPLQTSGIKLLTSSNKTLSNGTFFSSQTVLYTARSGHTNISCAVQQTDDEGNLSESYDNDKLRLSISTDLLPWLWISLSIIAFLVIVI